jgi:Mg2+/citrate symporter
MKTQGENGKAFRILKIFHIASIFAILLFAEILYTLPQPPISFSVGLLLPLTVVLTIIAVFTLILGYFADKLFIRSKKVKPRSFKRQIFPFNFNINVAEITALTVSLNRMAFFNAAAIYGLVLGLSGDKWQITVPFFVVTEIALIINFPTQKRWQQLLTKISESSDGQ